MSYPRARGGTPRQETGSSPGDSAAVVAPSDTVSFAGGECRALYVGVGGDVSAVVNGMAITFKNTQAGSFLPVRASRVNATATTATDLVAIY